MLTLTVEIGPGMFDTILSDVYELAFKLRVVVKFEGNGRIWHVYPSGYATSLPEKPSGDSYLADLEEWEPIPGDLTGRWRKVAK